MNRIRDIAAKLTRWLPFMAVTVFGLWMIWPIPTGQMPLSADHTVHLQRIWMWSQVLEGGNLRGWSSAWFFGTPVGELYPVLGDAIVLAFRLLLLDMSEAYALGFTVVFLAQGWAVLRAGKAMELGVWPGLIAALLVLADVGGYREGGWIYGVYYGVWPQALATALTWWGFGELAGACRTTDSVVLRRRIALAALALGSALLAHPASLLVIAIGGPLAVLTLGMGSGANLRRAATAGLVIAGLSVAISAWWLLPMLRHRAWMASYGWLWLPLERMVAQVLEGRWCQSMAPMVGASVVLGMVAVGVAGSRPARFFGVTALVLWVLSSRDVVWGLRLDLVSEGFTHLQYQRFITAAKPGLFLMAGAAVGLVVQGGVRMVRRGSVRSKTVAGVMFATGATLVAAMAVGQRAAWDDNPVAEIQQHRMPDQPAFDRDDEALATWMREQWAAREAFYRATIRDQRNVHWFVDLTARSSGMPIFKQGFTPGDNFVHKPESGAGAVLDKARVRYEIRRTTRRPGPDVVATFGAIQVSEREGWDEQPIAWLDGPGTLEVLQAEPDGGPLRVRIRGSTGRTRVVFGIAGFPRWGLYDEHDAEIPWFEVPVVGTGPAVTVAERRAGALRGGKAHGDDGTEPALIAADVGDGDYVLTYQSRTAADVLALLASLGSLAFVGAMLLPARRLPGPTGWVRHAMRRLAPFGHPAVLGMLTLAMVTLWAVRYTRGRATEGHQAVGWIQHDHTDAPPYAQASLLKTDMLIRPAIVLAPRHPDPATITFEGVRLDERLQGWVALDDDDAKLPRRGRHRIRIEARARPGDAWTRLFDQPMAHRPGRHTIDIPTADLAGAVVELRVVTQTEGKAPPQLGFDLQLGEPVR